MIISGIVEVIVMEILQQVFIVLTATVSVAVRHFDQNVFIEIIITL